MNARLYADTNIFIRLVERAPGVLDAAADLFSRAIDTGTVDLVTSELTLLELMVGPYRAGNKAVAAAYEQLLTERAGLNIIAISREVLITAALIRAENAVKTPDAIHIATAVISGCEAIATADRRMRGGPLPLVTLDDAAARMSPRISR